MAVGHKVSRTRALAEELAGRQPASADLVEGYMRLAQLAALEELLETKDARGYVACARAEARARNAAAPG